MKGQGHFIDLGPRSLWCQNQNLFFLEMARLFEIKFHMNVFRNKEMKITLYEFGQIMAAMPIYGKIP